MEWFWLPDDAIANMQQWLHNVKRKYDTIHELTTFTAHWLKDQ